MHLGKVTQLFHDQEYGFIKAKSGEHVHFHKHCLWSCRFEQLYVSQEVEFQMQFTHNGYLGFEVRPLTKESQRCSQET